MEMHGGEGQRLEWKVDDEAGSEGSLMCDKEIGGYRGKLRFAGGLRFREVNAHGLGVVRKQV